MRIAKTLVALMAFTTAACGPLHLGATERAGVTFTNDSPYEATVYALAGSAELVKIGTVGGTRTENLFIPTSITDQGGQTRIVARVNNRVQRSTPVITLRATDQIRVRLTADAATLLLAPP
jgi:hypothetical protein